MVLLPRGRVKGGELTLDAVFGYAEVGGSLTGQHVRLTNTNGTQVMKKSECD